MIWVGTLVAIVGAMYMMSGPKSLGIVDGQLKPCPNSPNCVNSFENDVEPFPLQEGGFDKIKKILSSFPRTRIISMSDDYIHAEVRSKLMRFVDDIEFLVDKENGVVHVRSASRLGYSDLGVNRKRVEAIRKAYLSGS